MAFSISLQSTNFRASRSPTADPISGWGMPSYIDLGLSDPERKAAIALLTRKGGRRPGIDDRTQLTLPDGTLAEVHLVGLYSGAVCTQGTITIDALSQPFLQVAVELAAESKLMLRFPGYPRPLVVSEELRSALLPRYPTVQSAFSAAMIWNLLVPRQPAPAPLDPAS